MRNPIYFVFTLSILFSCGNRESSYSETDNMDMVSEELAPITRAGMEAPPPATDFKLDANKKIIKDARIGIEVINFQFFRSNLDSLVKNAHGYISNDNLDKTDTYISSEIIIRLPAGSFESFIMFLENGQGKLLHKSITARDVTEDFIDIGARLKTKKEVEKRYIQLLTKAKNVKEILEVEEKLRILREEIESKEGRLNYLKQQVAYSTINLHVIQELDYTYVPGKEKDFFQRVFKSIDKGWKGFVTFIVFLFRIWPILLIGLATFYYIRRIRKNKKNKTQLKNR